MQTVIERAKPARATTHHRAIAWRVAVVLAAAIAAIAIILAVTLTPSQVRPVSRTDAGIVTRALQVMHEDAYGATSNDSEAARLHDLQVMHEDAYGTSNDTEAARLHALQQLKSGR